jgi:hypothetical protein
LAEKVTKPFSGKAFTDIQQVPIRLTTPPQACFFSTYIL